jgi:ketosteroid isomerase-like protein
MKVIAGWLQVTVGFFAMWAVSVPAVSQAPQVPEEKAAVHDQLRAFRDSIMEEWNKRDIDAVLAHLDPDVVVTWQNGEVNRGPAAVRKFYSEMLEGDGRVISNIVSKLTVDNLSTLYGDDTAIAVGSIHDDISFAKSVAATSIGAGNTLGVDSRWTATLVRKAGEWKLASYHVSANLFSNPVTDLEIKAAGRMAGIIGFAIGVVVALLLAWALRGRKRAVATG